MPSPTLVPVGVFAASVPDSFSFPSLPFTPIILYLDTGTLLGHTNGFASALMRWCFPPSSLQCLARMWRLWALLTGKGLVPPCCGAGERVSNFFCFVLTFKLLSCFSHSWVDGHCCRPSQGWLQLQTMSEACSTAAPCSGTCLWL